MDKKERTIESIKQEAIRRAKQRGPDFTVWQSDKQKTFFFTAHKDTNLKNATRVWP